jgi:hypothetical protein
MVTISVQLKNDKAIKLLEGLEELDIIKLLKKKTALRKVKIASKLSDQTVKALHKHVVTSREEWERR